jgi:hypothetical protein
MHTETAPYTYANFEEVFGKGTLYVLIPLHVPPLTLMSCKYFKQSNILTYPMFLLHATRMPLTLDLPIVKKYDSSLLGVISFPSDVLAVIPEMMDNYLNQINIQVAKQDHIRYMNAVQTHENCHVDWYRFNCKVLVSDNDQRH